MLWAHLPLFLLSSQSGIWGTVMLDEISWGKWEMSRQWMCRTAMSAQGPGMMDPTSSCSLHLKI